MSRDNIKHEPRAGDLVTFDLDWARSCGDWLSGPCIYMGLSQHGRVCLLDTTGQLLYLSFTSWNALRVVSRWRKALG